MYEYWLKQRNSNPPVWCPYQMPTTVITGLAVISPKPPSGGTDAGWFAYDQGEIDIILHEHVQDEIRTRILGAIQD